MPSSHLILGCLLLLLPPIPPSIRVFSNESTLRMRWPKYWSFSFSLIPSKEIPGLISFSTYPVGSVLFSSDCPQDFLFIFSFQQLDYNVLWCIVFCIYLAWVSQIFLNLWIYVFKKFDNYLAILTSTLFWGPSLLSFWDIKHMLDFNIAQQLLDILLCWSYHAPLF